ncbi:DUF192 domain-containing protein [Patescibacteria group bacterium]
MPRFIALILLVPVFIAGCSLSDLTSRIDFDQGILKIGNSEYNVNIAESLADKTKGLRGFSELPEKTGMLFNFTVEDFQTFWNKGVDMALDLIWIKDGEIIGITENIPPINIDTDIKKIPLYTSPGPVDQVLEVPAGTAEAENWEPGDSVDEITESVDDI